MHTPAHTQTHTQQHNQWPEGLWPTIEAEVKEKAKAGGADTTGADATKVEAEVKEEAKAGGADATGADATGADATKVKVKAEA